MEVDMLTQQTVSQLKALKLDGMARAFEEQLGLTASSSLSFEERFGIVVDRELAWRDTRRLERLLKAAKLKNPQACVEDIEYRQSRGIDQRMIATLAGCDWVRHAQNLILTGPTGAGKTWIACAFGQQACRQGFSVFYVRVGRLFEELKIAHGDGSFSRRLAQLAKADVLLLDDWGLQDLDQGARNDLLEVLDDRVGTRSTVITSQLPLEHWHAWLQDPTLADAILDRLVHQAHKLPLKGESMRKTNIKPDSNSAT
jgi:DNA replication protein DnaC